MHENTNYLENKQRQFDPNIYRPVSLHGAYTCTWNIYTTRNIHLLYLWGYVLTRAGSITEEQSYGKFVMTTRPSTLITEVDARLFP